MTEMRGRRHTYPSEESRRASWADYAGVSRISSSICNGVEENINGWVVLSLIVGEAEVRNRAITNLQSIEFISALLLAGVVSMLGAPTDKIGELTISDWPLWIYFICLVSSNICKKACWFA